MANIIPDLTVKFDGFAIVVPKVTVNMTGRAVNDGSLSGMGKLLRTAQSALDQIPTNTVGVEFADGTSPEEIELLEAITQLNAEVVLRILVMRSLVTAGRTAF